MTNEFRLNETVKISGLKELEDRLMALGQEIAGKTLRAALMKGANVLVAEMKLQAPESTETREIVLSAGPQAGEKVLHQPGFLKSRIKRKSRVRKREQVRGFRGDTAVAVRAGVFGVPYVGHIEFGTAHQAANPFIRRAFKAKRGEVLRLIITDLRRRIEKAEQANQE